MQPGSYFLNGRLPETESVEVVVLPTVSVLCSLVGVCVAQLASKVPAAIVSVIFKKDLMRRILFLPNVIGGSSALLGLLFFRSNTKTKTYKRAAPRSQHNVTGRIFSCGHENHCW